MIIHFIPLCRRFIKPNFLIEMSSLSFLQQLNPISNKTEWKVVHDDYDYNQEIATSCYADMLHDGDRNIKFGEALKKAIEKVHSLGKKAHVLDIGTGTGLLSLLAIRHGADSVVACEAFLPMANCAVSILQENNCSDKIKVVKSHSRNLTVGEDGDLKQKANILVSEVFDTELIGEGAISTFNYAFENLLEDDCIVIPFSGTVYAQVIESDLALKWNKLQDWVCNGKPLIKIPSKIKNCPGTGAVHDVQLSEFDRKHFKCLSEVIPIFRFDWGKKKKISTHRQTKTITTATASGKAQVVFMWWDLEMDQDREIVISCAPVWEHPMIKDKQSERNFQDLIKSLPWRDHWMQGVYFLTSETFLKEKDSYTLVSSHDEYSFWFEVNSCSPSLNTNPLRPVCDCAFHFLLSRTRIGAINDDRRKEIYYRTLKTLVNKNTVCIVLSDVSLLSALCGKLGAKKVYVLSESPSVEKVCSLVAAENRLNDVITIHSDIPQIADRIRAECQNQCFDILVVSEPYFHNHILPWDNLAIWYMKESLVRGIGNLNCNKSFVTFPKKCQLKCCAVQFDNLWKIAVPLRECEGFSMQIFDDLIASAKDKVENYIEAQPLWEYPGIALTTALTLFEFDLDRNIPKSKVNQNGQLKFESFGICDGIALWMEYQLTDDDVLSFGPVKDVVVGDNISWDMFERQGVHLFRKRVHVSPGLRISYEAVFDPQEAEFNFNFSFKDNSNESY